MAEVLKKVTSLSSRISEGNLADLQLLGAALDQARNHPNKKLVSMMHPWLFCLKYKVNKDFIPAWSPAVPGYEE